MFWDANERLAKPDLSGLARLRFVTTTDFAPFNFIDAKGRLMGVAFDGNIHSLGGAYGYDATKNRTVSVSAPAVLEVLDKVYGRVELVDELKAR